MPSRDEVFSRSALLRQPQHRQVADTEIPSHEKTLIADDCDLEIADGGSTTELHELCAVLTPSRLVLLGARRADGRHFGIALIAVKQVAVTRQGNLTVRFEGEGNREVTAKLLFRNEPLANEWMDTLERALAARVGSAALTHEGAPPPGGPTAAPSSTPASNDDLHPRLLAFLQELEPFASQQTFGQPFGSGYGLEQAVGLMRQHFADPAEWKACGHMVMVDLLVSGRNDDVVRDVLSIMGATDAVVSQQPNARMSKEIGEAAIQLLQQHGGPGPLWDLWQQRDDVTAEMLCWHSVARLRMANAGLMDGVPQAN
jgi:hypothetical protein